MNTLEIGHVVCAEIQNLRVTENRTANAVVSMHKSIQMTLGDEESMLSNEIKAPTVLHQNLSSISPDQQPPFLSLHHRLNSEKWLLSVIVASMHETSHLCT